MWDIAGSDLPERERLVENASVCGRLGNGVLSLGLVVLLLAGCGGSKYAGLTANEARHRAEQALDNMPAPLPNLSFREQKKRSLDGNDAWFVYFEPATVETFGSSGCFVVTTASAATPSPRCSKSVVPAT
jgi:hypothetical protein